MNNNNSKFIIPFILSLMLFSACNKNERNNHQTDNEDKVNYEFKLKNGLKAEINEFIVRTNKDTIIEGSQGVKLFIPKNSFVDSIGNIISGIVNITMKEIISIENIIAEEISTITNDGFLETGGMVNIQAKIENQELKLAKGKKVEILFPKNTSKNKNMNLYFGKKDEDGVLIWESSENKNNNNKESSNIVKDISILYRQYESLDNKNAYFKSSNSEAKKLIDSLLSFSRTEENQLLYKRVKIYWILFDDGDLEVYDISNNISNKKKKEIETKLNGVPFIEPFIREGEVADMDGIIEIVFKERDRSKKYDNFYSLTTSRLGWINCDIFIKFNVPKVDMIVNASIDNMVKIKFKNYKTIVTGKKQNGVYIFHNLPINEPIEILAFNYSKSGIGYSSTRTKVDKTIESLNPFEIISMKDLKFKLNELE